MAKPPPLALDTAPHTRVVSAERMRALEAALFARGLPALAAMETAGRAVAERVLGHLRAKRQSRVCVIAGRGNNGADGVVAARVLHHFGAQVSVCLAHDTPGPLLETQLRLLPQAVPRLKTKDLVGALAGADVVIDALYGIGARRPLLARDKRVVALINEHARFTVAVDVPSGLVEGGTDEDVVRADETVSFGALKAALTQLPGRDCAGELVTADIGLSDEFYSIEDGVWLDARWAKHTWRSWHGRPTAAGRSGAHKGDFGHLLCIGGSTGMGGALTLATMAALRSGVGLCSALPLDAKAKLSPEVMRWEQGLSAHRESALCIGPGLGTSARAQELVRTLLATRTRAAKLPTVIDADALNLLASDPPLLATLAGSRAILTPHPLEFTRLFGGDVAALQRDRVTRAREAARRAGVVIVLKGAGTVVAAPDGRWAVCSTGGRELAKGGSGDVLSGLTGAFIAARAVGKRPHGAFEAACLAAYLHGRAGALCARSNAAASVLPTEVANALRQALTELST